MMFEWEKRKIGLLAIILVFFPIVCYVFDLSVAQANVGWGFSDRSIYPYETSVGGDWLLVLYTRSTFFCGGGEACYSHTK